MKEKSVKHLPMRKMPKHPEVDSKVASMDTSVSTLSDKNRGKRKRTFKDMSQTFYPPMKIKE